MPELIHPNFLNLPPELSNPDTSGVLILPLPLDITASWKRGTGEGPQAIIAASHHIEYYDEEVDLEPASILGGVATHATPELSVAPELASQEIAEMARELVRRDRMLLALGGEHAITAPLVEAHREVFPDLCVLQIDAHADMRSSYMGSPHNHACPMRRIMETGVHVTSIGVRSMDASERPLLRSPSCRIYLAHEVVGRLTERADEIIDRLPADQVYVTVDLDGFDPSVVPAVGTPIPGGLGWNETLFLLRRLAERKRIIAADVVELSPREGLHYADAAAARLVFKLIAYTARGTAAERSIRNGNS